MGNEIPLTNEQVDQFRKLWFIYGNDGPKCTLLNHKLVQGFYQYRENRIDAYKDSGKILAKKYGKEYAQKNGVTQECIDACLLILKSTPCA